MSKFITLLTTVILTYFVIGTHNNDANVLVWLASSNAMLQALRLTLIAILIMLFWTDPPRNVIFRAAIGTVAVATILYSVLGLYSYSLNVADSASLLLTGIVIAVVALEASLKATCTKFVLEK